MFEERPAGSPQAMKAWFYPGNSTGEEFIYPKKQAVAIAKANHEPVLATDADTANSKSGKVARVDENGNELHSESAGPRSSSATCRRRLIQRDAMRRTHRRPHALAAEAPATVGTSRSVYGCLEGAQTGPLVSTPRNSDCPRRQAISACFSC